MKKLQTATILLLSSLVYFVAGIFWRIAGEVTLLVDLLNLIALLLLLWGTLKWERERKMKKQNQTIKQGN